MKEPANELETLKEFGKVMTVPFALLGTLFLYKQSVVTSLVLYLVGLTFLLAALFAPKILKPIEYWWMKFAEKMSVVVTFIILTLLYFLVVTPFGWLFKVIGRDELSLKIDKHAQSYWIPVEADGPASRPYTPY